MNETTVGTSRDESLQNSRAERAVPSPGADRPAAPTAPGSNGGRPADEQHEEIQMHEAAGDRESRDSPADTVSGKHETSIQEQAGRLAPPVPEVRGRGPGAETPATWTEPIPSKISVRDLDFWYGDNQVLFGNDLEVAERRVTAIIGPSGCGKSTHIRVYNRMFELYRDQRASGTILLDGENLLDPGVDLIDLRRRVGMIFQRPTPFPMSVFDNVAYGLRLHYKISRTKLEGRVEQALRGAALWDEVKDKLDEPGTALSGGQQQRLCIARAIAVEPEVLLMDEPTSAVDPVATAKLEELIDSLKEQYTIVIVTHNMQQAARISDFTAFFYKGYVVEFGPTERIFTNPSEKRTEDYITGRFG